MNYINVAHRLVTYYKSFLSSDGQIKLTSITKKVLEELN